MNNKALTLSLVMAVIAVFFVNSYVTSIEDEAKKKFGTEILVVTAKKDIKEMDTIDETLLELKPIPKKFLEPSAISFENREADDKEVARDVKRLAGTVAIVPIKKGEQLTYNKFTEPSVRTGLSPQVTPGKRGFSVPVNETSGVGKLVKPGDRVDLLAVIDTGAGKTNKLAKTILQDVVVLAVGRSVTNNAPRTVEADPYGGKDRVRSLTEDTNYSTVTLEVEPAQAQELALILAGGDNILMLSLRHNDDQERVQNSVTSLADILGQDASKLQRVPGAQR